MNCRDALATIPVSPGENIQEGRFLLFRLPGGSRGFGLESGNVLAGAGGHFPPGVEIQGVDVVVRLVVVRVSEGRKITTPGVPGHSTIRSTDRAASR